MTNQKPTTSARRPTVPSGDRIYIAANGQVVEFTDPAEAARAQTALLQDAPEATTFTVTVEFADGDSWSMTSWRDGDTVYCKPDLRTRKGRNADPILHGFGIGMDLR